MNKKIEIKNIKVNNGQELITQAQEYKNSGGEWKLREFYWEMPKGINSKRRLEWGIIISNGEKEIKICSLGKEGFSRSGIYDQNEVRDQLHQIFPRAAEGLFAGSDKEYDEYGGRPVQWRLDHGTSKIVKETSGECWLIRYLVAENSWHLKQILHKYFRDNETKIYQSANPHFSDWVEIIDGQDGNIYLYVGEKNEGGGREIKIGIKKSEFEKGNFGEYNASKMLEMNWGLFTIDRPRTPAEEKDYYYKALSANGDYWTTLDQNWEKTCRFMLEEGRRLYEKRKSFLEKEPNGEIRNRELDSTKWMILTIDRQLEKMKKNHPDWYNNYDKTCPDCGNRMCCHHWGNCGKGKNQQGGESLFHEFLISGNQTPNSPPPNQKNNQISKSEKKQLLQYFLTHNITKITLNNGKLVIEYNGSPKEQKEVNNSELEKYQQFIQNQPNHSISLNELQNNTTSNLSQSNPNKNKHQLAIGLVLGAGAVILVGIVVYFARKRKKK